MPPASPRIDGPDHRHWLHLAVAAGAMTATLPGRTHGLGLITEPLLKDLDVGRVDYAAINLWATLLGAAFCLPCGWLLDRAGRAPLLLGVCALLGLATLAVSFLPAGFTAVLFLLILLTRGFGQSALSVVSLTVMGKALGKQSGLSVAIYSVLSAVGFMAAFGVIKAVESAYHPEWRVLWGGIGAGVIAFGLIGALALWLFPAREAAGAAAESGVAEGREGFTLRQALASPAFWVFALATSFYGMIASGVSLFNQSILEERGFDRALFLTITTAGPLIGLAANLGTGALAARLPLQRLLAAAMACLAFALSAFPFVTELWHVWAYAVVLAVSGGMIMVLFFAVWAKFYGTAHLGQIQGAAQMLTVFASALGPLLLALSKDWTDSYVPLYRASAVVAALFAVTAWLTPQPGAAGEPADTPLTVAAATRTGETA